MKKVFIGLFFALALLTGCASKDLDKYKNISDIVVGLYSSPVYDGAGLEPYEKELIDNHLKMLKQENSLYDIEERMVYLESLKTTLPDSPEIIIKNDRCHVNFSELEFINRDDGMSPDVTLVCKGYEVFLLRDFFDPKYENLIENPVYNYDYYGYKKVENGYKFMYISNYDSSGVSVYIAIKNEEVSDISVIFEVPEKVSNPSPLIWIAAVIVILLITAIAVFFFVTKRKSKVSKETPNSDFYVP